ncbi:MAG: hypothetical protein KDK54_02545 [Leptospiraceae bacterium]|nr:hypothetical protein [Leptospiraceae bacterium]
MKKEKVIRLGKWTSSIHNSNEKRIKTFLKSILPDYKNIEWTESLFKQFYIDILNDLPSRYKQKNSIEISGRLKNEVIISAIKEKLNDLSNENPTETSAPTSGDTIPFDSEDEDSREESPKTEENLPESESISGSSTDEVQPSNEISTSENESNAVTFFEESPKSNENTHESESISEPSTEEVQPSDEISTSETDSNAELASDESLKTEENPPESDSISEPSGEEVQPSDEISTPKEESNSEEVQKTEESSLPESEGKSNPNKENETIQDGIEEDEVEDLLSKEFSEIGDLTTDDSLGKKSKLIQNLEEEPEDFLEIIPDPKSDQTDHAPE